MSKIIRGNEEEALAAVVSPGGTTNDHLLEILDLEIDEERSARASMIQYIGAWIARKFGKGEEKKVFAVQDDYGVWIWKPLRSMTDQQLQQLQERDMKILAQTEGRAEQIRRRIARIEMERRQLNLFEADVPEKNARAEQC